MKCAGVTPAVTATPRALAARTKSSAAAVVTCRKCSRAPLISASAISRATASASASAGALGRPSRRGHFAGGRRRIAGQPAILGMAHDHQVEHRGILQQAQHRAAIGDPVAPGRDRLRPGIAHQRHFGEVRALEADGGSGERVDPEVGLAALRGEAHCARAGRAAASWSGISAARVMPPKWNAGLSIAKTPKSTSAGATNNPRASTISSPSSGARSPTAAIAPSTQRIAPASDAAGKHQPAAGNRRAGACCFIPTPPRPSRAHRVRAGSARRGRPCGWRRPFRPGR